MKRKARIQTGIDDRLVAIYARKSRITNKGDSIGVQFKQSADYAINQLSLPEDYEFARYEDKGLSGYYSDRPDFQRLLRDIEMGKIKAVAAKDNITAIKIKSSRMLLAHGFLRKVFEIFESYQTSIDMICTSEVGVSMSIDNTKHLAEILNDLKKYGTVTVDSGMCIICVVGDLEWENIGFEAKALDAMRDIPVRMISFGGSNYNISFLIRECDKKKALQSLSNALFSE